MFLQEISIINQIYTLLGVTQSDDLDIIVVFIAGIVMVMLVNNTLGALFKGLMGGYDR